MVFMSIKTKQKRKKTHSDDGDLSRIDDRKFGKRLDALIAESEEMRLNRMRQHRTRSFISMNLTIFSILLGVAGFGWFFLVQAILLPAVLSLALSLIPPVFLHVWAARPLKTYVREHKTVFMPKLAKTLNGLKFHPERGVSSKIIGKLAVIPAHDRYEAEDCFMGTYKGVKVIFSEARLYSKNRKDAPLFDGIFVLLETPESVIDGHTIITANSKMVKAYSKTRWKTMQEVHISVSDPEWDKFDIYSTKPESAELIIGDRLLKELSETSEVFDDSPLTAVLFGKKYVFMMIPYEPDMFEASSLFVPVTTKSQAMRCKKEIEQLLEIIDVFDLYEPLHST
ncbi:MAG: hypothetical protein COB36_04040 [Alphaproteobacteria bacterium]|nr:MAG: hypothetical protein COB36_04040 [Alphaproteobacteria bacterium]